MSSEMSETRLYLGNLPRQATKKDVEDFFNEHGHGSIQEVKLMNGFGFIEYSNPNDARDIVPDGKEFMDSRLTVQFARGPRPPRHEFNAPMGERGERPPRPRRTTYRMNIAGLPTDTSWQDLKDFARKSGVDVVFSEVSRNRDGAGTVEFETADDLRLAINKLDDYDFKGVRVSCTADENRGGRGRSRSPPMRGGRNFSPRGGRGGGGHSPRGGRGNYSPPPRGEHRNDRGFRDRSPYGGGGGGGGGRDYRRGGDYRGDRRRNSPPRGGNSGGGPQDDHYSGTRNNAGGGGGGNRGNYDDNSAPRGNRYNRDDDFRGGRGGYGGGGGGGGNNYSGPRGGGGGGGSRNDNNDNNNTNNAGGGGRPSPPSRNRDDDYGNRQRSDRY